MSNAPAQHGKHEREVDYLRAKRGIMSWLVTVDHKRLGIMYLASVLFFFLIAGVLALTIRAELLTPEQDYLSALQYNQVMALHGATYERIDVAELRRRIPPLTGGGPDSRARGLG